MALVTWNSELYHEEAHERVCAHPLEEGPGQIVAPFIGARVGDASNYIEYHLDRARIRRRLVLDLDASAGDGRDGIEDHHDVH